MRRGASPSDKICPGQTWPLFGGADQITYTSDFNGPMNFS